MNSRDQYWMEQALTLAKQAASEGEVPVGALVVLNDTPIARAYNQPIVAHDPSAHAEVQAIRKAAAVLLNYRLVDCTLYVTLEPCAMCAGAMVHARIKRLVYGASDPRSGVVSSHLSLLDQPFLNHRVIHQGGVMANECGAVLSAFFKARRS